MPEFTGFPPAAIAFLEDLEAHNDRDWFKANRDRYDDHLVAPALALGRDLARFGPVRLFRPYNDTRFHPRPPVKEHIGIPFGFEGGIGCYVELSLDGLLVAAGVYRTERDQVARLREAVADDRTGPALVRALGKARRAGLEPQDPDLVRVPRGYDADHPRAPLLRHRRLVVGHREATLPDWLHTAEAGERIGAWLDAAAPTVRWLREHVGPPRTGAPA